MASRRAERLDWGGVTARKAGLFPAPTLRRVGVRGARDGDEQEPGEDSGGRAGR